MPAIQATTTQDEQDTLPPESPAEEVATSEVNEWADFVEDTDDGDVEGEFEVSGGDTAEAEPIPETVEVPAQAEAVVPEPRAPAAAEPVPEPVTYTPEPQPQQPAQPVQTYTDWRTQQEGNLEKYYALDSETAQALLTEPETVLPRLAARVHLEVTENVLRAVQGMFPGMIQQYQTSSKQESEAETAFYSKNADLRGVDPHKILQVGAMFRQVNPKASPEEAVVVIGSMVRAALGMTAPAPAVQPPMQASRVQPYTPTRGSGGAAERVSQQSNPWAELFTEDD